jgi:hypothetical protein
MVSEMMENDDSDMLETEKHARENPEAVRAVAERCGDPLKSKLLSILERVENDE